MLQDLTWFEKRIGQHISRGTTQIFIDSLITANKLFYLQDKKYTFSD